MRTAALFNRAHYPSLGEWAYLNQASLGLVGEPAVQAMHAFLDDVGRHGNLHMTDADEVAYFEALRQRGAVLLGCRPTALAILAGASELLGQLPFFAAAAGWPQYCGRSHRFPGYYPTLASLCG